jgi:uncharacterized protein YdeI (YjbR/CyaY-like superfamily)
MTSPPLPLCFDNAPAFRRWLRCNAADCPALLVLFRKVATGRPCMSYSESVDEALCFGWIDGVRKRVDDHSYSVRFTPRRASSIWSAVNIARVHRLQAEGRTTHAGESAFALRTLARSATYAHEQDAPADLSSGEIQAFKRNRRAWTFFDAAPLGYRKLVLHWVSSAKKADTRAARVARLVQACAAGERLR